MGLDSQLLVKFEDVISDIWNSPWVREAAAENTTKITKNMMFDTRGEYEEENMSEHYRTMQHLHTLITTVKLNFISNDASMQIIQ